MLEIVALISISIILFTRFYTGLNAGRRLLADDEAKLPPKVPYWVPGLGHLLEFLFRNETLLRTSRDTFPEGVFTLNLLGSTHNVVYSPSLIKAVLSQSSSVAEYDSAVWIVRKNVFGIPASAKEAFHEVLPELQTIFAEYFLKEPQLGVMIALLTSNLEEMLPNLVSFTESPVDQALWERVSSPKTVRGPDGELAVETSLLPLIRDFMGYAATPTFTGRALLENYPGLFHDLWTLDSSFFLLATGLPRWAPIPRLTSAHIARRRLLAHFTAFHSALSSHANGSDPDPLWRDLSDVSPALLAGRKAFAQHNLPIAARAASDLGLVWAMNANANVLVFWLLLRILSTPGLVSRVRAETAPYARAEQPAQTFALPEPPRLRLDVEGLWKRCPLLKSCYMETLRLDSAPFSVKRMRADLRVVEGVEDAVGGRPETWLLRKGEYVDVPYYLHHTDVRYFIDPEKWVPERHMRFVEGKDGVKTAEWGSVRAYGGGRSMCKGRLFAEKECLAFVAGFLALWEVEPVDKAGWKIPKHGKATAVAAPKSDVRVRLRRRVLVSQ